MTESLHDLFQNPDRFDEADPDNMLQLPSSKYYSIPELNDIS
jgi:hypothetical protein